ncbi:MAG: cobaltochelatase subunit CobN, partial [Deltaproteobacteria bacterium]|nr:cobaltochelatase subunit CobN [Deltaproteobacteria bacterium]
MTTDTGPKKLPPPAESSRPSPAYGKAAPLSAASKPQALAAPVRAVGPRPSAAASQMRRAGLAAGLVAAAMLAIALFPAAGAAAESVAILANDAEILLVHQAVDGEDFGPAAEVRAFCLSDLRENPEAARFVKGSKAIAVDVMGGRMVAWLRDNELLGGGRTVFALRGSTNNVRLMGEGIVFDKELIDYYGNLSLRNVANMALRAVSLSVDPSVTYGPVEALQKSGLYHPAAPEIFASGEEYLDWYRKSPSYVEGRPWLGLMFYATYLLESQRPPLDRLIAVMEEEGFNVYPAFGRDLPLLEGLMLDSSRRGRVDAAIAFSLRFAVTDEKVRQALRDLDAPVYNGMRLSQTTADWRASPQGVSALNVVMLLDNLESTGLIEPTVLMAKTEGSLPDGSKVYGYELLEDHARRLAGRIRARVALKTKPAADKRVALMYWNNSRGKQNIGASYLNVFRSMSAIVGRLAAEGYDIPLDPPLGEEDVKGLVLRGGRNIGSWAPGELDSLIGEGNAVLWPVSEYLEHFRRLPQEFRDKVIAQWGRPEDAAIMARDGNLVIPVFVRGNLAILPQGSRGAEDDPMKLYHDSHLYPHHQYIAVYLWLERVWKADAVIHLGTHGTLEWLPGKQAGLALSDPPEALLGELPVVYPYIVDDVGEGIQAKRRGRAVAIDHLTPPLVTAGAYQEYVKLAELVEAYQGAARMGSQTAAGYLEEMAALAASLGMAKELEVDDLKTPEAAEKLSAYLEYLAKAEVPYGLHTFGTSPAGNAAESLLDSMTAASPALDRSDAAERLAASGPRELDSLVRALSGGHVDPGEGNDPVRNPAAVPTGRNFYGISPARVPTPAAWKLGRDAADQIIRNHLEAHGEFPDKVAVVLWALEALRSEGVGEATVLALIGVEPVWDPSGAVFGTRPIPGAALGRPRVDVAVDASSLYRDLFPDKILFLDRAIRQAAVQDDVENFIARGDESNRRELLARGYTAEEAGRFSRARIFSARPGAYGNRVSGAALASGQWDDPETVSRTFREQTGYAYGQEMWGEGARDSLELNLSGAKVAWHSRSSRVYGVLDNDDNFMYLGGLTMAITSLSERPPDAYIVDSRSPGQVRMAPLAGFIGQETRARYLNPTWIEGMKAEGYSGAGEMSDFVEFLWGWQVTAPQAVDTALWDQSYEVYVEDKYGQNLPEFMDENNAWAFQSITGRMLEAVRKGYWAPSEEVRTKLASDYAMSVINRGVACCDHTCNNPMLNQMVMNIISLPGVMSPELAARFKAAIEEMGKKPLEEQAAERANSLRDLGERQKAADANPPREAGPVDERAEADSVRGLKME